MRDLIPWLVTERDFRRYLGRALDAARAGRVVLFYHKYKDEREPSLICLAPEKNFYARMSAALHSYRSGRFRRVVLQSLPKKK